MTSEYMNNLYRDLLSNSPQTVAKCVADYFAGKSEEESQRYIDLCMSADKLK